MSNNNPWSKDIERLENGNTSSSDSGQGNSGFTTISLNEGFGSETTNFTLDEEDKNN